MRALLLVTLLQGLMSAQTPPALSGPRETWVQIEKGLQSTTPLQVAVSAYNSVSASDPRRGEWLRNALSNSLSLKPEPEALRATRAILDALIRTRTQVPLAELLPFYDRFPAAVIAVVASGGPRSATGLLPLLLKTEQTKNTAYWYAVASLMDGRELLHHLVGLAQFDYAIAIVDRDFVPVQVSKWLPHGVLGGLIGHAPNESSAGWPPETDYQIEMSGDLDQQLTAGIGEPTYLKARSPRGAGDENRSGSGVSPWDDHDREIVRILASIASCGPCQFDRPDYPNVRGGRATIVWHSPDQARALLVEAVDQFVKECSRMIAALGEPLSDLDIRQKVRIWIRDWRAVQTSPIPTIGAGIQFNLCAAAQHSSLDGKCIDAPAKY